MSSCGYLEDAYHLFFVCKKHSLARQSLISNPLSLNYLFICYFEVTNLWLWIEISKYSKQYKTLYMSVEDSNNYYHFKTWISNPHIHVYASIFFLKKTYEISHNECKYFWRAIQLIYTMSVTGKGLYVSFWTCVQSFWFMSIKYVQFNSYRYICKICK